MKGHHIHLQEMAWHSQQNISIFFSQWVEKEQTILKLLVYPLPFILLDWLNFSNT